jgi:hypothetical protein
MAQMECMKAMTIPANKSFVNQGDFRSAEKVMHLAGAISFGSAPEW